MSESQAEPQWGLRLLLDEATTASQDTLTIDIIAVHGLGSNPDHAWVRHGVPVNGNKVDVKWLTELLPRSLHKHKPSIGVRLFCYNYQSAWIGPKLTKNRLETIAGRLLDDLHNIRLKEPVGFSRPILFIGHSFGGLVIEQAVVQANSSSEYRYLVDLLAGVILLGTPHTGSKSHKWGSILAHVANLADYGETVLMDDVDERSMKIFDLICEFMEIMINTDLAKTKAVVCFSENAPTNYLRRVTNFGPSVQRKMSAMVVEETSAVLPGVKSVILDSDHLKLNKFTGASDGNYVLVSSNIARIAANAPRLLGYRQKSPFAIFSCVFPNSAYMEVVHTAYPYNRVPIVDKTRRQEQILASLSYPEQQIRERHVPVAHARTFEWLLSSPDQKDDTANMFLKWLRDHEPVAFWICGKAGSGKSTLMKTLISSPLLKEYLQQWSQNQPVVISQHFFFGRGKSLLQRSREGMLRSLLYQILDTRRDLIARTFPSLWAADLDLSAEAEYWSWERLLLGFYTLTNDSSLPLKLFIVVDGLDEYESMVDSENLHDDGEDFEALKSLRKAQGHTEIARFFHQLALSGNVKVCISSRGLQRFETVFSSGPHLRLECLTKGDIEIYVGEKLVNVQRFIELTAQQPYRRMDLVQQIIDRADGVFLWVRLVTESLLEGLEDFDTIEELEQKVKSLPGELGGRNGLYMQMLKAIKPEHQAQAARLIRMVRRSQSSLPLVGVALTENLKASELPSVKIQPWTPADISDRCKIMERRLKSRYAGFVEVREALLLLPHSYHIQSPETVQFIHQTAKDFLDQSFTIEYLSTMAPQTDIDTDIDLVRLMVASINAYGTSKPRTVSSYLAFTWIMNAMHYASAVDAAEDRAESIKLLLDELDRLSSRFFPSKQNELVLDPDNTDEWPLDNAIAPFVDTASVACLAVGGGLVNYIATKLSEKAIHTDEGWHRPLLEYAVAPRWPEYNVRSTLRRSDLLNQKNWTIGFTQSSPAMVQILLDHGANPNQSRREFQGIDDIHFNVTPWTKMLGPFGGRLRRNFILEWSEWKQDRRFWAENAILMIKAGADCKVLVDEMLDEIVATAILNSKKSALFQVHQQLRACPDLREMVVKALEENGAFWRPGERADLGLPEVHNMYGLTMNAVESIQLFVKFLKFCLVDILYGYLIGRTES